MSTDSRRCLMFDKQKSHFREQTVVPWRNNHWLATACVNCFILLHRAAPIRYLKSNELPLLLLFSCHLFSLQNVINYDYNNYFPDSM